MGICLPNRFNSIGQSPAGVFASLAERDVTMQPLPVRLSPRQQGVTGQRVPSVDGHCHLAAACTTWRRRRPFTGRWTPWRTCGFGSRRARSLTCTPPWPITRARREPWQRRRPIRRTAEKIGTLRQPCRRRALRRRVGIRAVQASLHRVCHRHDGEVGILCGQAACGDLRAHSARV